MFGHGSRLVFLPVVAYVALIFLLSSIPKLNTPGPDFFHKDKLFHFFEYVVLGVLLCRGIGRELGPLRFANFGFLVAVAATVGALDEVYQSYIPGREMNIYDWCADAAGASSGVGLFAFVRLLRTRRASHDEQQALGSGDREQT
ncbi:MAG: VanZ family protein [Candidatus Krumholzibacteria bacterium]|nr:VanZ family protein [Candidatus Krumholzibacteria bacterium]